MIKRYYLLVCAISLLPLVSIFTTQDLLHTHDGLVHLPRIAAYFKALSDGQIPVRWVGDLNYGYGMPLFNFIYQLPYFIASVFLFLGVSLVSAFKLTLAASFILSGVFIFAFANAFFQDEKKAFFSTIFYQFAPFRLVELLSRGSFGEVYTYAFLPLVLFGLTMFWKKKTGSYFLLAVFATALLVLSHNSVSLLFFAVSLGFILFFAKDRKNLSWGVLALVWGLGVTSFYWIPAILEHKYTYGDLFMKNLYLSHFAPVKNFLIPNITNHKSLQIESVSVQIGLFHLIGIIIAAALLLGQKLESKTKKLFLFLLLLISLAFFFMQPISRPLWENISFLRQFQFPWRFLSIIVIATSLLSVSFLMLGIFKKQVIYYGIIILVVISTVVYWRPQEGYDKIDEGYYWNFPLNTTYYGETDLIWSAGPASSYPKERVEIISGEGEITNYFKKSNLHTFSVDAKTEVGIVDRTQYFPGWRVYVDGKQQGIEFQDPNFRGLITFTVPAGISTVKVVFGESKLRFLADIISVLSLSTLLWIRKKQFLY